MKPVRDAIAFAAEVSPLIIAGVLIVATWFALASLAGRLIP